MKKIIGTIILFFGILETLSISSFLIFVMPKMLYLYESFDVEFSQGTPFIYPILFLLIGITNILVGLANFEIIFKDKSDLFYKIGIALAILNFTGLALVIPTLMFTSIAPLYTLTENL